MPPVGFEPTISAGERPQTYALDHAATGTGTRIINYVKYDSGMKEKSYQFTHCSHTPVSNESDNNTL